MIEQQIPEHEQQNKKWLPDDPNAIYEKAETIFGPESPDYLLASISLQNFVEKMVYRGELPDVTKFSDLQSFLKAIAQQIGDLPFGSKGIGESSIANQALILGNYDDIDKLTASLIAYHSQEIDCKLPTAATGYLLNWYFFTKNWPLEVGMLIQSRNAHVYVTVKPKAEATQEELSALQDQLTFEPDLSILIDFLPISSSADAHTSKYKTSSIKKLIPLGKFTEDTHLAEGLIEYDKRYLEAVAEKNKLNL